MKSFKEIAEARFAASADFKLSTSGRKVHKMKKIADNPEDLDKDGDVDANDKKLAKESVQLEEGTVKTSKYSWGTMKHVEHGHSFSIPLHPEHHQAIHKLKDGESHSFTDETKSKWKATREGDKVHFHGASRGNDSYKTTVKHDDLKESCAPVAPVPDRKYIKGTPEWKANKEKNKPRTGHPTNEEVELDEVLDMRHHTTGTGSIHVSHTHTSPSRVHSIGYTDAHKISNLKAGEKHEYKNANGHENFTAHKQSDGSTKIHDDRGTHVATIKNKMGRYDGQVKESLDEAVDKQEQRLLILARLGLVDKSEISKLRIALEQMKADKSLTVQQRTMLLGVMEDLISLVTGDDMVFNRIKQDVQKEDYELVEEEEIIIETKDNDKDDVPFDGPYTKKPSAVPGKNGSGYSTARHLARLALQKQQKKQGK